MAQVKQSGRRRRKGEPGLFFFFLSFCGGDVKAALSPDDAGIMDCFFSPYERIFQVSVWLWETAPHVQAWCAAPESNLQS